MFYELKHPLQSDYFRIESGVDFSFPSHMHYCFELIYVKNGVMEAEVDGTAYYLSAGDALLVFPNQIHSMKTLNTSTHTLCVFSPKLVNTYAEKNGTRVPVNNRMKLDPYYARKLECMNDSAGIIEVKGLLYSVCADFDSSAEYRDVAAGHHQLLYVIFRFIENNYMNDCTLAALAKYTTYDYAYLSRYFKNATGLAYNDYVTQYRISHACYLLQSTEKTILDVSVESGFNSLRSMNRNFKNQLGVPPAKYRLLSKGEEHKISDYDKDGKVR